MIHTRYTVPPTYVWLAPAAALTLIACYAEVPGSAPADDSPYEPFADGGITQGSGPAVIAPNDADNRNSRNSGDGGGESDAGSGSDAASSSNAEPDATVVPPTDCDGTPVGTVQTRKLYAEAQVVPPATCKSETQTRTCRSSGFSAWSGTYQSEQCTLAAVRSCGALPHGATRTRERYAFETVNDFALCVAETQMQSCNDGTLSAWSGTSEFESCEVAFRGRCNPLSAISCVAGTTCALKGGTMPTCVGTAGHSCSVNAECNGTCVNGSCAPRVPNGGSCDEAIDCMPCSNSAAVACTNKVCVCANGASCSANNQCQGTCVARVCSSPNTACDNNEDCSGGAVCSKAGGGNPGTCLLKDGQACTLNAQCEHVCRPIDTAEGSSLKVCAPKGSADKHCDENIDCTAGLVCRMIGQGPHCATPGQALDACDELQDCAQTVATTCAGNLCVPTLLPSGSPCLASPQCQSGLCDLTMGSPGICATP